MSLAIRSGSGLAGQRRLAAAPFHIALDRLEAFASQYPARFAIAVFATLNIVWTLLFMTPLATRGDEPPASFIDALFTAVSVICVTGLATVDMATHWSPFGNALVLVGVHHAATVAVQVLVN